MKLKELYQMITIGGDAELELVDSMNPFTEGILFRFLFRSVFSNHNFFAETTTIVRAMLLI